MSESDKLYFQRCYELAELGNKKTRPNPKVGAVIVYQDRIIGEGFHQRYGESHAEVNAINDVSESDKHLIKESTIYVSLEPCHHFGITPPCVDLILKEKIPNVKIALPDPTEKVNNKSISKLRENKRNVTVVENSYQAVDTIQEFLSIQIHKRPHIQIKVAKSAHNYMGSDEEQVHLTNSYTNVYTHKLRAYTDAILIGTNTAAIDNPSLTTRHYPGDQPNRIVFDRTAVLSQKLTILSDSLPTVIISEREDYPIQNNKTLVLLDFSSETFLEDLCNELYKLKIYHIMVEGGSKTIKSFLKANLWDEAIVISTDNPLSSGIKAPSISGRLQSTKVLIDNTIHVIKNDM